MHDLEQAWDEGFRNAEILKRYTTTTMGPCQGAMCGRAPRVLRGLTRRRPRAARRKPRRARTTARPPARPVTLESLAAGVHEIVDKRTSLHERARCGRCDDRSVRRLAAAVHLRRLARGVPGGARARERDGRRHPRQVHDRRPRCRRLVDRLFPCRTDDLEPGRTRYVLTLDEAGYVIDDGCSRAPTKGLVPHLDLRRRRRAWMRVCGTAPTGWSSTRTCWIARRNWGAINVAGPYARDLLERLTDDPIGAEAVPSRGFADVTVAGVPCRAIRMGFVGELAFELHHPRRRGPGAVDARSSMRVASGICALTASTRSSCSGSRRGTSTWARTRCPTTRRRSCACRGRSICRSRGSWASVPSSAWLAPPSRRLVGLEFSGGPADMAALRGEPLIVRGTVVGRITSAERSIALDRAIGLGWVRTVDGGFPERLETGRGDGKGRADPVLRSERRSDAWLSCGSSIRRSSWCWDRGRPATRSTFPTARRRCASPPGS